MGRGSVERRIRPTFCEETRSTGQSSERIFVTVPFPFSQYKRASRVSFRVSEMRVSKVCRKIRRVRTSICLLVSNGLYTSVGDCVFSSFLCLSSLNFF